MYHGYLVNHVADRFKRRLIFPKAFLDEREKKEGEKKTIYVYADKSGINIYDDPGILSRISSKNLKYFFSVRLGSSGRFVLPEIIFDRFFLNTNEVIWEGWGKFIRIIPKKKEKSF